MTKNKLIEEIILNVTACGIIMSEDEKKKLKRKTKPELEKILADFIKEEIIEEINSQDDNRTTNATNDKEDKIVDYDSMTKEDCIDILEYRGKRMGFNIPNLNKLSLEELKAKVKSK